MKYLFAIILLCSFPLLAFADCDDFDVVCGVKHGKPPSSDTSQWSIGYHNEAYKAGGCFPSGGSHCGDHNILTYEDMPNNSVSSNTCYSKATKRSSDGCSMPLSDPVSRIWSKVYDAACQLHDICYSTQGASKDNCDSDFKNNINTICGALPNKHGEGRDPAVNRTNCKTEMASWTSTAVFNGMENAYKNGQAWAKVNCGNATAIKVTNKAWFATTVEITYKQDGKKKSHESDAFSAGQDKRYIYPHGTTDITLKIRQWGTGEYTIKEYKDIKVGKQHCYKVTGSAGLGKVKEVGC